MVLTSFMFREDTKWRAVRKRCHNQFVENSASPDSKSTGHCGKVHSHERARQCQISHMNPVFFSLDFDRLVNWQTGEGVIHTGVRMTVIMPINKRERATNMARGIFPSS